MYGMTMSKSQVQAKARIAAERRIKVEGVTARELGDELTRRCLLWVFRWGWASPSTLDFIAHPGRRGKAARLVERKLLAREATASISPDAPRYLLKLTELGFEELSRLHDPIDTNLIDLPVKRNQIRHDYILQNLVQDLLRRRFDGYASTRELEVRNSGGKIPDAIVFCGKEKTAVELEISEKSEREMNQTCDAISEMIKNGVVSNVMIFSTKKSIIALYSKMLQKGAVYQRYRQKDNRMWDTWGYSEKVDFNLDACISYYKIDSHPTPDWSGGFTPIYETTHTVP